MKTTTSGCDANKVVHENILLSHIIKCIDSGWCFVHQKGDAEHAFSQAIERFNNSVNIKIISDRIAAREEILKALVNVGWSHVNTLLASNNVRSIFAKARQFSDELRKDRYSSMENWPHVLNDSKEIASHVESTSPEDVDSEYIDEFFHGAGAVLRLIPTTDINEGAPDHNRPCETKQSAYSAMPAATRPPIVIEDGVVVDGNHRLRDAISKGETHIWCYLVMNDDDLALQPEVLDQQNKTVERETVYLMHGT